MAEAKPFKLFQFTIWHFAMPLLIGQLISVFGYPTVYNSIKGILYSIFYPLSLGIIYMKIHDYIDWKLDQYISWIKQPLKRLIIAILLNLFTIILVTGIINLIVIIMIKGDTFSEVLSVTQRAIKLAVSFTVSGIVIEKGILFFVNWKKAALNEEILKREKITMEYEALKNQVNPHFFFNSLSALSTLIVKDQQKAVEFVQQFSSIFRHILEYHQTQVIDLKTELQLLNSLVYLYKIRFGDDLKIDVQLPESKEILVIPMALQMLLENAIKHNIISPKHPLHVVIGMNGDYIFVKNNLQPKQIVDSSNKIGLQNIQSQYNYLSNKKVIINKSEKYFEVNIPILKEQ